MNSIKRLGGALKILRQILTILLITLILIEIVFRSYNYFRPSFIFYDASYNRYRGRANSDDYDFRLNSRGFKDVEFKSQKEPDSYRILGIGDSFAFGVVPYQYNYLTLLDQSLNQRGQKIELLNMGIPSIGPKEYYALLSTEGLELKPDMVLLSFFIGNDFDDDRGRLDRLFSYSYVASFIRYLIVSHRGVQGQIIHRQAVYDDNAKTLSDDVFIALESKRSEIYRKQSDEFDVQLNRAAQVLVLIKQLCDERHIALAVVLIPDNVQVDRSLQKRVLQTQPASRLEDFDFTMPNRRLATILKEHNIKSFDLLEGFATQGATANLYRPNDTHWNIAGNKLAAELIESGVFRRSETGTR